MVDNDQLIALARELPDELYYEDSSFRRILWWCEEPKERKAEELEYTLRFLLRRYCLVERSKVKNIHNGILVQLDPKNFGYSPYNQGRMDVMKSLFPDLGKEVDNHGNQA